ncbi:hypothetical protein BDEG_27217 [Batrachochytrium dendrobatidis JEL423]|uniref:Uncharacterized protein n=1 Tax=Batrachochytrium dendrobatidis (strain JEL423) TaxID=403673 RepID=A0A177WW39_BATDL|nr:hypothetical protein BDEG_27217 [Batrachochytrium dendrobatidis JEL423]
MSMGTWIGKDHLTMFPIWLRLFSSKNPLTLDQTLSALWWTNQPFFGNEGRKHIPRNGWSINTLWKVYWSRVKVLVKKIAVKFETLSSGLLLSKSPLKLVLIGTGWLLRYLM